MTPDPRLLLPATRELLEGWCGPGLLDNEPVLVDGDNGCVIRLDGTPLDYDTSYLPVVFDAYMRSRGTLRLDLSRAECRDRVARVVAAGRWPMQVQSTALRWGTRIPEERAWVLGGAWVYTSCVEEPDEVLVTALADLDPTDDTRLSDGSRLVDALALAAVARQVLTPGGSDAR